MGLIRIHETSHSKCLSLRLMQIETVYQRQWLKLEFSSLIIGTGCNLGCITRQFSYLGITLVHASFTFNNVGQPLVTLQPLTLDFIQCFFVSCFFLFFERFGTVENSVSSHTNAISFSTDVFQPSLFQHDWQLFYPMGKKCILSQSVPIFCLLDYVSFRVCVCVCVLHNAQLQRNLSPMLSEVMLHLWEPIVWWIFS